MLVTRQVTCGRALVVDRLLLPSSAGNVAGLGTFGGRVHGAQTVVAACGGEGRQTRERCAVCDGQGVACAVKQLVSVPAGITDGGRLRVVERDTPADMVAVPAISIMRSVQPHQWFRREGDDLVCPLPVAVHEAALGARIDVPSLEGPVKLRIPAGTRAGQRLRVDGAGLVTAAGGRGDLLFEVTLVLPARLDERSLELMRSCPNPFRRCQKRPVGDADGRSDVPGS